jgi:prevent-host-death family protein
MQHVGADTARRGLTAILRRTEADGERFVISVRGRRVAAIVPLRDLRAIELLEDRMDAAEAERILADVDAGRERTYSLEEVDRALGLVR